MSHVTKTGQDRSGPVLASPSFSWDPQDRDWDQDRTAKDWSVVLSFSSPTLVFDQSWTSPGQDSAALSNGLHGNYFCYNMVWTPALCIHDTLDMFIFFLPTLFVTYLMLDSYGQPHFLIDTILCPSSLFHLWFLPYYEYSSYFCSLIRTFLCTYKYIYHVLRRVEP